MMIITEHVNENYQSSALGTMYKRACPGRRPKHTCSIFVSNSVSIRLLFRFLSLFDHGPLQILAADEMCLNMAKITATDITEVETTRTLRFYHRTIGPLVDVPKVGSLIGWRTRRTRPACVAV